MEAIIRVTELVERGYFLGYGYKAYVIRAGEKCKMNEFLVNLGRLTLFIVSKLTFACPKSTIEALEKVVKYVQN